MAVPKRKATSHRKGSRRAHHALKPINTKKCQKCGAVIKPHTICASCNNYNK